MPLIQPSDYGPPWWLPGGHLQTIWPRLFRRVGGTPGYRRQAIDLDDGDVLHLDWCRLGHRRLVIVSHGLEGSSRRPYVRGMVRQFCANGWDALAWNYRGGGGEPNRTARFTTSASADDLAAVVRQAAADGRYQAIALVGFSMGGNLTLLYLGTCAETVPPCVRSAVVISAPLDTPTAALRLERLDNRLYTWRFLRGLRGKLEALDRRHPGVISLANYGRIRTLREFDDRYTAPLHGFENAVDYWQRSNPRPHLQCIRVPTLILNAENDPLLTRECFPRGAAEQSDRLFLETPRGGGHCGFPGGLGPTSWAERRAVGFAEWALEITAPVPGPRTPPGTAASA
jgi:uncharacterized protein